MDLSPNSILLQYDVNGAQRYRLKMPTYNPLITGGNSPFLVSVSYQTDPLRLDQVVGRRK